jgi:hypothetical protein
MLSGGGLYTLFFDLTRIPPNFKIKIMYNSVIMTTTDWAQFILALLSIGTVVVGSIRWYIKIQVTPIKEAVDDIRSETKTNGGSSMRDEIKFIKLEQERSAKTRAAYNDKLDHMYDILIDYISKNSK